LEFVAAALPFIIHLIGPDHGFSKTPRARVAALRELHGAWTKRDDRVDDDATAVGTHRGTGTSLSPPALRDGWPERVKGSVMTGNFLIEEPIEGVKRITLNRPDSMNSFTFAMYPEFVDVLNGLKFDPKSRVVILTAAGKAFCTGHDLRDGGKPDWVDPEAGKAYYSKYAMSVIASIPTLMRSLPQPIICAVNGTVAGMGYVLPLASDVAIAGRSAKFVNSIHNAATGCELGMSYLLPRAVGTQRAAELLLTSRAVLSDEAERIGLVLRTVPDEDLQDACLELAKNILVNVPIGIWTTKQSLWFNQSAGSLEQAMEMESRAVFMAQSTEDAAEKRKSFFEKRAPKFNYK
jgi:enoyl-CoA hydratase